MKRCDLTKGLVFFLTIIITLCCGLIPSSWALDEAVCGCTNKSLKGCYTFSQSGSMIAPIPPEMDLEQVLFASVGIIKSDGKGYFSGTETGQLGEIAIKANLLGEYNLDENCMGTARITVVTYEPEGVFPTLIMDMAVATTKDGQQFHLLTTSVSAKFNGNIVPSFMIPLSIVGPGIRNADY